MSQASSCIQNPVAVLPTMLTSADHVALAVGHRGDHGLGGRCEPAGEAGQHN